MPDLTQQLGHEDFGAGNGQLKWVPSHLSRFWLCLLGHAATELMNKRKNEYILQSTASSIPTLGCCSTPIRMPRAVCPTPYALGQNLSHGTDFYDFPMVRDWALGELGDNLARRLRTSTVKIVVSHEHDFSIYT